MGAKGQFPDESKSTATARASSSAGLGNGQRVRLGSWFQSSRRRQRQRGDDARRRADDRAARTARCIVVWVEDGSGRPRSSARKMPRRSLSDGAHQFWARSYTGSRTGRRGRVTLKEIAITTFWALITEATNEWVAMTRTCLCTTYDGSRTNEPMATIGWFRSTCLQTTARASSWAAELGFEMYGGTWTDWALNNGTAAVGEWYGERLGHPDDRRSTARIVAGLRAALQTTRGGFPRRHGRGRRERSDSPSSICASSTRMARGRDIGGDWVEDGMSDAARRCHRAYTSRQRVTARSQYRALGADIDGQCRGREQRRGSWPWAQKPAGARLRAGPDIDGTTTVLALSACSRPRNGAARRLDTVAQVYRTPTRTTARAVSADVFASAYNHYHGYGRIYEYGHDGAAWGMVVEDLLPPGPRPLSRRWPRRERRRRDGRRRLAQVQRQPRLLFRVDAQGDLDGRRAGAARRVPVPLLRQLGGVLPKPQRRHNGLALAVYESPSAAHNGNIGQIEFFDVAAMVSPPPPSPPPQASSRRRPSRRRRRRPRRSRRRRRLQAPLRAWREADARAPLRAVWLRTTALPRGRRVADCGVPQDAPYDAGRGGDGARAVPTTTATGASTAPPVRAWTPGAYFHDHGRYLARATPRRWLPRLANRARRVAGNRTVGAGTLRGEYQYATTATSGAHGRFVYPANAAHNGNSSIFLGVGPPSPTPRAQEIIDSVGSRGLHRTLWSRPTGILADCSLIIRRG